MENKQRKHASAAFSQKPKYVCKVKLRQFRREQLDEIQEIESGKGSSSEQERKVNALASGADEGRD